MTAIPRQDDAALYCRRCGRIHQLFVRVGTELACPGALILPVRPASRAAVRAAEDAARKRMAARGGSRRT